MGIDFGQHGLVFTRELCSAIECYTASEVTLNSRAYVYRGMDLRYAVERWLYIQGINSESLFLHYLAKISSDSAALLPTLNPLESDIAFFLCNQRSHSDHPPRRIGRRLYQILRSVYCSLRCWRPFIHFPQIPGHSRDILIHVHNSKFVDYLAPVARELHPDSYSYLVTNDVGLAEQLELRGLPVVGVLSAGNLSFRHHLFCSYALGRFLQLIHEADTAITAFSRLQPLCTLVVEGNAPIDIITSEASRILGIPCYCVQHGWSPFVHTGFRNMRFTEMFVWGKRFAELLLPYNPFQIFFVTGSHAMQAVDVYPARSNVDTISFFLQAPCALLGAKAYEQFVELIVDIAQYYSRLRVIVREHPGFPLPEESSQMLQSYPNVQFSIPAVEPLAEVINASDLVVSVFSTVLLEAMALNVVPLICSIGPMRAYKPAIASAGAAIEVHSLAEARSLIDEVIADPVRLQRIRRTISEVRHEFFSSQGAARAIASRLSDYCRKTPAE